MSDLWHHRARDILACIEHIERLTAKHDEKTFGTDLDVFRAVERNLEIIGEASKHLPEACKARYSNIPWKQILGTRNMISHEYGAVDEALIWVLVRDRLPELKAVMLDMLQKN